MNEKPFYNYSKPEREALVLKIRGMIQSAFQNDSITIIVQIFENEDTYIRKTAYLSVGRLYSETEKLRPKILELLGNVLRHPDHKVRQTAINSAGEIGKTNFESVQEFFDSGLFDLHHAPRNAVIGSIKKMGEVNPKPVLRWARTYLHHPDKEIRREICHGIELRGRKFPQDVLPLLKELEHDKTSRVRNTLVHVIGQISYKKGCLATVLNHLKKWENKPMVEAAIAEILDVHHRYRNFAAMTPEDAARFISVNHPPA